MKKYPIFITSSDSYSDLWPTFFDLFKKYWPEYDGLIYLNTEYKDFKIEGLNIVCTCVGNNSFGKTFRAGLDKVDSPYLMLMMIDFFIMGNVNDKLLEDYFEYFRLQNLDSLCLVPNPYSKIEKLDYKDLYQVIPPSKDMFTYQIAFWKKSVLFEMALPHETPWLSELYGTFRANKMKIKLAFAATETPILYLAGGGALQRGKWAKQMVIFLKEIGYNIDFTKRGFHEDRPLNVSNRIKGRIDTFWPRCLSNLDLFSRVHIK